jgi:hypothetical protein
MKKLKEVYDWAWTLVGSKNAAAGPTDWSARVLGRERVDWEKAKRAARGGPKVLIATSVGGQPAVTSVEGLLAVALTLRGAEVSFLLCDRFLPACLNTNVTVISDEELLNHGPQRTLCDGCAARGFDPYEPWGLPILRYSQFITAEDHAEAARLANSLPVNELRVYQRGGVEIGDHAYSGTLRHFARGTLDTEPNGEAILRRYFAASLLTALGMERLFAQQSFAVAVFHHGIYTPQGSIGDVARAQQVRVVNWAIAYRRGTILISHDNTYHRTMLQEPVSDWEDLPWTAEMEKRLMEYLHSRARGTADWIEFGLQPEQQMDAQLRARGIDPGKVCIGLLTNVIWDAQIHFPANAFDNMIDWVMATIRSFAQRPELQLVIRVHPGELRSALPSRQPLIDEIRREFPTLPANVFIIPPEDNLSTYDLIDRCDAALIYGTKTGIELIARGIPVIVAGEAWVRNKGMTMDASSPAEYEDLLDRLPIRHRLDKATTQRARKYAYHFFFRRMIPLHGLQRSPKGIYSIQIESLAELQPEYSAGIDVVCDAILHGSPFLFPLETENSALSPAS